MVKPYNSYVNSLLSWSRNDGMNVYDFKLRDLDVYDIGSGAVTELKFNEIDFMVDMKGRFVRN